MSELVGPVRIRSANCRADDHGDCLGMVEQDAPGLGITDCLCQCHPFEPTTSGIERDVLAAALEDHRHPGSVDGALLLRRDHLASWVDGFDCAAAILAAMPDHAIVRRDELERLRRLVVALGGSG